MTRWKKELNIQHFPERIKCPFCPKDAPDYPSNLALCRHVLHHHNWNKDFLKDFEIIETIGSVMIVKEVPSANDK